MAKDYNIDDILSEVKQRRAEQESNLKSAPAPKAAPVPVSYTHLTLPTN